MTLSWCFYAPRWIFRLPVDLSGSLTATTLLICSRTSKPPGQSRGWRVAIRMVCFTLSLTVTLTLWCCSVPVSAACVWRRPLSALVKAGTPRGRVANATSDHSTISPTPMMDSIHGQDFANIVTSPPESRLGLSFTWFASILLYDQCLISLP